MEYKFFSHWDKYFLSTTINQNITLLGKLKDDIIGSGSLLLYRENYLEEEACEYIKESKKCGLGFNYILDTVCMDNKEFDKETYLKINELLIWLVRSGVSWVTVSHPFIIHLIKSKYPQLKITISSLANITTIKRAQYFVDMGADELILDESINRDFLAIKSIRENISCKLSLYANSSCIYQCPNNIYHSNYLSHTKDHCKDDFECHYESIDNPMEVLKAGWIRPEDTKIYEKLGIDSLVIIPPKDNIQEIVCSYLNRRHNGSLLQLLNYKMSNTKYFDNKYIDNNKLEGFLDFLSNHNCLITDCSKCNYCYDFGKKANFS